MHASHDGAVAAPGRLAAHVLAVFVLVAAYLLPIVPIGLNVYDEGVRLYGAQRILQGDLPYHDFFAYYGPGQFYWPAALFALFGQRVLVARLGQVLFVGLAATAVFVICRRAGVRVGLAMLPVAALALPLHSGDYLVSCDPSFSLLLVAGAVLTDRTGTWPRYLASGLILGLAGVFRHDFGAYGSLAALVTTVWIEMRKPRPVEREGVGWSMVTRFAKSVGALATGILLVVVPSYGVLAFPDPGRLVEALILLPPRMMPFRALPYLSGLPPLSATPLGGNFSPGAMKHSVVVFMLTTPPLSGALILCLLVPRIRCGISDTSSRATALVFILTAAAGVTVYSLGRSGGYHVYPLHVLSSTAACLLAAPYLAAARPGLRLVRLGLVSLVSFVLGAMLAVGTGDLARAQPLDVLGASRIMVTDRLSWVRDAVQDIQKYSQGRPIFVASDRHDRVHWNAVILYFLARQPSGTYFHDFIPGVTTTQVVQERIVGDLQRNGVELVVVWKAPLPTEPNESRFSSNVHVLDSYLRSRFVRVRETESYDILVKR